MRGIALLVIWSASAASAGIAQMPPADPADVGTIEGIVHAFYDVINGPAGTPRQWRRPVDLYNNRYTDFASSTEAAVRQETYGEDIGAAA